MIEVTPLERDEWQHLQIELSVRPVSPDGIVYHAELNLAESSEPQLFHNIALRGGHVVYTYDIGAGAERIQSNDPIEMGEWSKISVRSNPSHGQFVDYQHYRNTYVFQCFWM